VTLNSQRQDLENIRTLLQKTFSLLLELLRMILSTAVYVVTHTRILLQHFSEEIMGNL
jgi:hypothetical protein